MSPYQVLRERWPEFTRPDWLAQIPSRTRTILVSGENWFLGRGFFSALNETAASFGEERWWMLDLSGEGERYVEFLTSEAEQDCFRKAQAAPTWSSSSTAFPYAVRHVAFVGSGDWLLICDRDAEQMHFVVYGTLSEDQLTKILTLIP